jgi:hypothetical protein
MSDTLLRWNAFQKELDRLVLDGHIPGETHPDRFSELGKEFSLLRRRSKETLNGLIDELKHRDEDNPAFLSVSLLGLLHGTGLRETAHTRLLAWIFDPNSAGNGKRPRHGLTKHLFVAVIKWAQRQNKLPWASGGRYSVKRVDVEKCTTEGKKTDIWIEGEVKYSDGSVREWLAVIEAKVKHQVTGDQLKHYQTEAMAWQKRGAKKRLRPWLVFLKDGSPAGDWDPGKQWTPLSFVQLFEILWPKIRRSRDADGYQMTRYYLAGILSDIEGWTLPLEVPKAGLDYQMLDLCKQLKLKRSEERTAQ